MKIRIFWGHEEVYAIARSFVSMRMTDPFTSDAKLLVKAMKDALPEDKWRNINAMDQVPQVKSRIKTLWEVAVTTPPAPASTPPSPVEPPEPTVIEIEVEKPIDFQELAERLDGPTLAALAFTKLEKMMSQLSLARVELPKAPEPSRPPISVIESASRPRKTRVAVVAPPGQFSDIESKVNGLSEKLDIRFVDKDKNGSRFAAVEYAIILSASSHTVHERAKQDLGNGRVFFVEGISRAVQKLYDIASRRTL